MRISDWSSDVCSSDLIVERAGPRRLSPFVIPSFLGNLAAGHVSIRRGLQGPLGCPVTACAPGAQAIGDAARLIRAGDADVMVAGGAEACIDRVRLARSEERRVGKGCVSSGWSSWSPFP